MITFLSILLLPACELQQNLSAWASGAWNVPWNRTQRAPCREHSLKTEPGEPDGCWSQVRAQRRGLGLDRDSSALGAQAEDGRARLLHTGILQSWAPRPLGGDEG